MKFFIFCLALLVITGCTNNQASTETESANEITSEYKYEPSLSRLTGTLTTKLYWGPPNYGEDTLVDEKETEYILVLDKPISVLKPDSDISGGYNAAIANVTKLQLIHQQKLESFLYKKVNVTGTLFGAQTGHHHTNVLLDLKTIH